MAEMLLRRLCSDLAKHEVVLCSEWSVDPHDSLFVGDLHTLICATRLRCTFDDDDDDDDDDVVGELWRYGTVNTLHFHFPFSKIPIIFPALLVEQRHKLFSQQNQCVLVQSGSLVNIVL